VDDLRRAIGLSEFVQFPVLQQDHRFCAFDVGGRGVFLLFLRGASTEPMKLPLEAIPPHDSQGPWRLSIPPGSDAAREKRLRAAGVSIEHRDVAARRSKSCSRSRERPVELLTPGVWATC
jgi:hypothetical protein